MDLTLSFDHLELFPMSGLPLRRSKHINGFLSEFNQTIQGAHDVGIEKNPNKEFSCVN